MTSTEVHTCGEWFVTFPLFTPVVLQELSHDFEFSPFHMRCHPCRHRIRHCRADSGCKHRKWALAVSSLPQSAVILYSAMICFDLSHALCSQIFWRYLGVLSLDAISISSRGSCTALQSQPFTNYRISHVLNRFCAWSTLRRLVTSSERKSSFEDVMEQRTENNMSYFTCTLCTFRLLSITVSPFPHLRKGTVSGKGTPSLA